MERLQRGERKRQERTKKKKKLWQGDFKIKSQEVSIKNAFDKSGNLKT